MPYTVFTSQLYNACAHSCSNFIKEAGLIISKRHIYLQGRLTIWLLSDLFINHTWSDWQQHLALTQFLSLDSFSNITGTLTISSVEEGKSWKASSPLHISMCPYIPDICPETSQPKTGGRAHCQGAVFQLQMAGSDCTQGNWGGVLGLQTGPKCYVWSTPQYWAEIQSSRSPKKLVVWEVRKPGKGWALSAVVKDDKQCCHHSWWWPWWGRCWSTVFRKPSRAGHFDFLSSAAITVTWAPQGFPNPALLPAVPDPAPPPELVMCPQKPPGL